MLEKKQALVNGIKVNSFNGFDDIIDNAVKSRKILVALNSDKLYYSDERLKKIINANIGYCDGIGAVYALRKKGIHAVKTPGCELWLEIIKKFPKGKYYLVGAEEEVINGVVSKIRTEYPGIDIRGFRNGFLKSDEEKTELINDIAKKKPDFVFIAMGSPKQEYLLEEIHSAHPVPMMGLGGSFNVYIGRVKRAPRWMINMKLEWLHRLVFNKSKISWKLYRFWCGIRFFTLVTIGKI